MKSKNERLESKEDDRRKTAVISLRSFLPIRDDWNCEGYMGAARHLTDESPTSTASSSGSAIKRYHHVYVDTGYTTCDRRPGGHGGVAIWIPSLAVAWLLPTQAPTTSMDAERLGVLAAARVAQMEKLGSVCLHFDNVEVLKELVAIGAGASFISPWNDPALMLISSQVIFEGDVALSWTPREKMEIPDRLTHAARMVREPLRIELSTSDESRIPRFMETLAASEGGTAEFLSTLGAPDRLPHITPGDSQGAVASCTSFLRHLCHDGDVKVFPFKSYKNSEFPELLGHARRFGVAGKEDWHEHAISLLSMRSA